MNRQDYLCGGAYQTCARGEELPHSKLTEADVRQIKRLHAKKQALVRRLHDRYGSKGLAEKFGVHVRTIEKVLQFDSWGHIRGESCG